MKENNFSGAGMAMAGLATGSIIGLIAGMLYAPKSGEETRRDLNNRYNEARSRLRYKTGRVKDTIKSKASNREEDRGDNSDLTAEESDIKPVENQTSSTS